MAYDIDRQFAGGHFSENNVIGWLSDAPCQTLQFQRAFTGAFTFTSITISYVFSFAFLMRIGCRKLKATIHVNISTYAEF